MINLFS